GVAAEEVRVQVAIVVAARRVRAVVDELAGGEVGGEHLHVGGRGAAAVLTALQHGDGRKDLRAVLHQRERLGQVGGVDAQHLVGDVGERHHPAQAGAGRLGHAQVHAQVAAALLVVVVVAAQIGG